MLLELEREDMRQPLTVVGRNIRGFFAGTERNPLEGSGVRAQWAFIGDIYVGRWIEYGDESALAQEPVKLRVRIGINTGVASVGSFGSAGRKTYSAVGTQTNLAARLQAECPPGGVLASHATWALVRDGFEAADRGETHVKRLHFPVRRYEVLGPRSTG